ncbi:hypothetical protein EV421DRAFT_1743034 [Armillaria borealis]|uniref:Uncharacterized protein n=1 Tax=Armillaria borealis TaxID=47425 RepID=A0AA39ME50_9AGAR|nr:hypothetical protein EV421DRAFT_1743034 [Armillaria borealis]
MRADVPDLRLHLGMVLGVDCATSTCLSPLPRIQTPWFSLQAAIYSVPLYNYGTKGSGTIKIPACISASNDPRSQSQSEFVRNLLQENVRLRKLVLSSQTSTQLVFSNVHEENTDHQMRLKTEQALDPLCRLIERLVDYIEAKEKSEHDSHRLRGERRLGKMDHPEANVKQIVAEKAHLAQEYHHSVQAEREKLQGQFDQAVRDTVEADVQGQEATLRSQHYRDQLADVIRDKEILQERLRGQFGDVANENEILKEQVQAGIREKEELQGHLIGAQNAYEELRRHFIRMMKEWRGAVNQFNDFVGAFNLLHCYEIAANELLAARC